VIDARQHTASYTVRSGLPGVGAVDGPRGAHAPGSSPGQTTATSPSDYPLASRLALNVLSPYGIIRVWPT
jgi:hypothetical protein